MITFHSDDVKMPRLRRRRLSAWIRAVAASYGRTVGQVGYLFVSDDAILSANRRWLSHDYYTDIITFDYDDGEVINGDIMISLDRVRSNALTYGKTFDDELSRVIIHGILHLCGLDDKTPPQRETMEAAEDRALSMLS